MILRVVCFPKNPFVCSEISGLHLIYPTLRMGLEPIINPNSREGSGFLGFCDLLFFLGGEGIGRSVFWGVILLMEGIRRENQFRER